MASEESDRSLVLWRQQIIPRSPASPEEFAAIYEPHRADITKWYGQGLSKQRIVYLLDSKHYFDATYYELHTVVRVWGLEKPAKRRNKPDSGCLPTTIGTPISTILPGVRTSSYLEKRCEQDIGLWLLTICTNVVQKDWNVRIDTIQIPLPVDCPGTDTSPFGRQMGLFVLYHSFAIPLSSGVLKRGNHFKTQLAVLAHGLLHSSSDFSNKSPSVESLFLIFCSVVTAYIFEKDEGATYSMNAMLEVYRLFDMTYLDLMAKLDLFYVLRFQQPPVFGSVFAQSQHQVQGGTSRLTTTGTSYPTSDSISTECKA